MSSRSKGEMFVQWVTIRRHRTKTWHDGGVWNGLARAMRRITTINSAHMFSPPPPLVAHPVPIIRADSWGRWAAGAIPHAKAVASRQGMVRVGNRWVLHTMNDSSRAKLGHSLGGELQRGSNDCLDGLSIPASQGLKSRGQRTSRPRSLGRAATPTCTGT